jgi:hypothetical protein
MTSLAVSLDLGLLIFKDIKSKGDTGTAECIKGPNNVTNCCFKRGLQQNHCSSGFSGEVPQQHSFLLIIYPYTYIWTQMYLALKIKKSTIFMVD